MKENRNYIDKQEFLQKIIEYKERVKQAAKEGKPKPPLTNYFGKCITDLANNIATRPEFRNYPFREDMIQNAIENVLLYFDNFDPEKSNNPYGYFSQFIFFSFIRTIKKEKRELAIKQKSLTNSLFDIMMVENQKHVNKLLENEYMSELLQDMEEKEQKKKNAKRIRAKAKE